MDRIQYGVKPEIFKKKIPKVLGVWSFMGFKGVQGFRGGVRGRGVRRLQAHNTHETTRVKEWRRTCPKLRTQQVHFATPLKRQSRSTSRASSARQFQHRINSVSPLPFALATCERKLCVSCGHRPPSSSEDHEADHPLPAFPGSSLCCRHSVVGRCPPPDGAVNTQSTCRSPIGHLRTEATRQQPLQASCYLRHQVRQGPGCANALVVTLPPASRHILATTFTNAHPLPPNTPARASC